MMQCCSIRVLFLIPFCTRWSTFRFNSSSRLSLCFTPCEKNAFDNTILNTVSYFCSILSHMPCFLAYVINCGLFHVPTNVKTAIERSCGVNLFFSPMVCSTTKSVIFWSPIIAVRLQFRLWILMYFHRRVCKSWNWLFTWYGTSLQYTVWKSALQCKSLATSKSVVSRTNVTQSGISVLALWADVYSLCHPKLQSRSSRNGNPIIEIQGMLIWNRSCQDVLKDLILTPHLV